MSTAKRLVLTLALATSLVLLAAGVAFAAGTDIPHGGYSAATDACLQCHDVHEAASDYVLLRWETVTDTCGSCHFLYLGQYPKDMSLVANQGSGGQGDYAVTSATPGQVPAYAPGYDGSDTAPAPVGGYSSNSLGSRTSAYEVDYGAKNNAPGHTLQRGWGAYDHADGVSANGAYIPAGGGNPLTALDTALGPQATINTLDRDGTNGLYCASCHTPHGNFGYLLEASTKILSSKPNHVTNPVEITDWTNEGDQWCVACHVARTPGYIDGDGNEYHNHPQQMCLICHANDVIDDPNGDFPHTGENDNLLSQEPDGLCVGCHYLGSLP